MQEYEGQPCLICGQDFSMQDDVVTCPDCGTPYHRACYRQTGHCINTALHESGESWIAQRKRQIQEEKAAQKRAEEAEQAAMRERGETPPMINGSLYDGVRLNPDDPCIGLDPEEQMDGVKLGEVAAFVRTNRFYYLPLFRLMKRTGKKISLNLLGLFCPQFFFANRKMWGMSILVMLLNMLLNMPYIITTMYSMGVQIPWADITTEGFQTVSNVCFAVYMILSVIWCMFANYMYYRFTVRRINGMKRTVNSEDELTRQLASAGGTSLLNVLLLIMIQFTVSVAVIWLLMLIR